MTETTTMRVRIEGRVQGVWFRAWAAEEADRLGVEGWIRNRRDGSVEALFRGTPDIVERMIQSCWRGPPGAHVTAVDAIPDPEPVVGGGFTQKPTV